MSEVSLDIDPFHWQALQQAIGLAISEGLTVTPEKARELGRAFGLARLVKSFWYKHIGGYL